MQKGLARTQDCSFSSSLVELGPGPGGLKRSQRLATSSNFSQVHLGQVEVQRGFELQLDRNWTSAQVGEVQHQLPLNLMLVHFRPHLCSGYTDQYNKNRKIQYISIYIWLYLAEEKIRHCFEQVSGNGLCSSTFKFLILAKNARYGRRRFLRFQGT